MKEDSVRMRVVAPALVMSLLMLGVAGCTPFRPGQMEDREVKSMMRIEVVFETAKAIPGGDGPIPAI